MARLGLTPQSKLMARPTGSASRIRRRMEENELADRGRFSMAPQVGAQPRPQTQDGSQLPQVRHATPTAAGGGGPTVRPQIGQATPPTRLPGVVDPGFTQNAPWQRSGEARTQEEARARNPYQWAGQGAWEQRYGDALSGVLTRGRTAGLDPRAGAPSQPGVDRAGRTIGVAPRTASIGNILTPTPQAAQTAPAARPAVQSINLNTRQGGGGGGSPPQTGSSSNALTGYTRSEGGGEDDGGDEQRDNNEWVGEHSDDANDSYGDGGNIGEEFEGGYGGSPPGNDEAGDRDRQRNQLLHGQVSEDEVRERARRNGWDPDLAWQLWQQGYWIDNSGTVYSYGDYLGLNSDPAYTGENVGSENGWASSDSHKLGNIKDPGSLLGGAASIYQKLGADTAGGDDQATLDQILAAIADVPEGINTDELVATQQAERNRRESLALRAALEGGARAGVSPEAMTGIQGGIAQQAATMGAQADAQTRMQGDIQNLQLAMTEYNREIDALIGFAQQSHDKEMARIAYQQALALGDQSRATQERLLQLQSQVSPSDIFAGVLGTVTQLGGTALGAYLGGGFGGGLGAGGLGAAPAGQFGGYSPYATPYGNRGGSMNLNYFGV